MKLFSTVACFALVLGLLFWPESQSEMDSIETVRAARNPDQKAILVTGASSGIGRATALLLAQKGFFVYAGARKEKDLKELSAIKNIQGIKLDVTIQSEIDAAVKTVEAGDRGLYGLINNAGVVVLAPLIEVSEEDMNFQMNVNVFGPFRVTKAFAPLIIKNKGRISTTGSLSGSATWGMGGPYSMSKHAIEAFTDVLAMEVARFGVHVSLIEPGNYKSKIAENMRKRFQERGFTSKGSRYKNHLDRILAEPKNGNHDANPQEVAQAFLAAMTDKNPKRRYLIVPNQKQAEITIRSVLKRVAQLNKGHAHSYTRDQLVRLLDEELKK